MALVAAWTVSAQDTQDAVAEAAAALSAAEDVPEAAPRPKFWTTTLLTNINFGQSWLHQWAAGGYNTISLTGNIDASTNYAKDKMILTNRLQLE